MEQRVVESQTAYPSTSMQLSSRVEAEMSDQNWMARHQLMKPIQLSQFTWDTTDARDTDLYDVSVPNVLENKESLVLRTLRMYSFYKISPCFRIQINSTQFHQGQLICSFDPFWQSTRPEFNHIYATGLPNVKVMASESDAVELCVPFIHPRSFLTTNTNFGFNNLGQFRVTVLNPLSVADGSSPSLTVTVWLYAKDASVHVPIQDHTPLLEPTFGPFSGDSFSGFGESMTNLFPSASPIISKVKQGYGQVSDLIGNVTSGNFGQALRKGQGLIDTLGDLFGFDYPSRTLQPPKTISPVENLAVGIGQSQSQRLAIDPFSLHVLQDDIASESIDAMNLLKIARMPMLLTQFDFSNQPADTLLYSCPISPAISALYNNKIRRTYLSYVSNAFNYWSGGINFDIEIVATRFHSGKLLFAYVPNTNVIPSYADASASLPNVIVDIQQTSKTTFKIPFTSSTAMKNVFYSDQDVNTQSKFLDAAIGTLVCYVQNTLAFASNVNPSIEVNLYISAGDDFKLYVPSFPIVNKPAPPALDEPQIVPTVGIGLNVNKNNEDNTMAVLSLQQDKSIARNHFGEDYSLVDIIRRFSRQDTLLIEIPSGSNYETAPNTLQVTPFANTFTYLSYWANIYSAWSGSLRYKFIPYQTRSDDTSMQIHHLPNYQLNTAYSAYPETLLPKACNGLGVVRTNLCQDVASEIDVPYYSKYNMLLTYVSNAVGYVDNDYGSNGFLYVVLQKNLNVTVDTPINIDRYIAAGEDFRFIYLRSPPSDTSANLFTTTTLA